MRGQPGMTLIELMFALAVASILIVVAVPGVAATRASLAAHDAPRRLAMVLRAAQARAQASGVIVRVHVQADGAFAVMDGDGGGSVFASGELHAPVDGNYPGGTVEFGSGGLPFAAGGSSPRAGHFTVGEGSAAGTVTVQLGGCVRCG